jgi:hypothetical protein
MMAPGLRDRAILCGWIAGIILLGILIWGFTQGLQVNYLMRAVNRVFIDREDSWRINLSQDRHPITVNPMGIWYSVIDSSADMFVFAIIWDGILIPCGALVSPEGKVTELLPLSGHAIQALDRLPQSIVGMYIRRIEAAAAKRSGQ